MIAIQSVKAVGASHFVMVPERFRFTPAEDAAALDDRDVRRNGFQVGQDVRGNDHGAALIAEHGQYPAELDSAGGVQPS